MAAALGAVLTFVAILLHLVEGVVHQLLLLADHVAELVDLLLHLARSLAVGLVAGLAGLQAVHEVAHLGQHLLGLLARAVLGGLFQLAHHAFEIVLAELLIVLVLAVLIGLAFVLLGELLDVIVHRLAQLFHELFDLGFGSAVVERFGQLVLGVLQATFGVGEIAVFEPQRDLPQLVDDAVARGAGPVAHQPVGRGPHSQIGVRLDEALGLDH